jgi:hypothetical protein
MPADPLDFSGLASLSLDEELVERSGALVNACKQSGELSLRMLPFFPGFSPAPRASQAKVTSTSGLAADSVALGNLLLSTVFDEKIAIKEEHAEGSETVGCLAFFTGIAVLIMNNVADKEGEGEQRVADEDGTTADPSTSPPPTTTSDQLLVRLLTAAANCGFFSGSAERFNVLSTISRTRAPLAHSEDFQEVIAAAMESAATMVSPRRRSGTPQGAEESDQVGELSRSASVSDTLRRRKMKLSMRLSPRDSSSPDAGSDASGERSSSPVTRKKLGLSLSPRGQSAEDGGTSSRIDQLFSTLRRAKSSKRAGSKGKEGPVFGTVPPSYVPMVVRHCCEAIGSSETLLNIEGLFRVSGSKVNIDKLALMYNVDEQAEGAVLPTLAQLQTEPVHDITGLLKLYMRTLAEPLFLVDNFDAIVALGSDRQLDSSTVAAKLRPILQSLPEGNVAILRDVVLLLKKVLEHSEENKMSLKNLAVVFGPMWVHSGTSGNSSFAAGSGTAAAFAELQSVGEMMAQNLAIQAVVSAMIEEYSEDDFVSLPPPAVTVEENAERVIDALTTVSPTTAQEEEDDPELTEIEASRAIDILSKRPGRKAPTPASLSAGSV